MADPPNLVGNDNHINNDNNINIANSNNNDNANANTSGSGNGNGNDSGSGNGNGSGNGSDNGTGNGSDNGNDSGNSDDIGSHSGNANVNINDTGNDTNNDNRNGNRNDTDNDNDNSNDNNTTNDANRDGNGDGNDANRDSNDNLTSDQNNKLNNGTESEDSQKKKSCVCVKSDFFPEESFKSWSNYGKALMETRVRLKERLMARSSDDSEIHGMRARSQHQMKRTLNWFDLIWFGVGAVMGAGVFVLTGEAAHDLAGPAVLVSYLISGCAALLSVICYTEFAVELPVAGGSFAYLRVELGDFVAFIAAGNILFEYVVAGASVSRSWTSYFATLCNHKPNEFRINIPSMGTGFDYWDPMAVVVSILICIVASFSVKGSSRFNSIATIIHIGVLIFIIIAGSTKANLENFDPFAPFGIRGILKASSMIFFAYVGFDGVATLGEETKKPGRDIPIGLVGSMLIVITTYSLLAMVVCLMQPYDQIDVDAPFTIAFEAVGMNWAKVLVGLGALKGMTTVLLATIIAESRYFTHIARTHMAPPILAMVHKKLGTPVNAAVIMTATNCLVAFFTSLDVLASLLSISTLFIFSLVAIGLLVRRYYSTGVTSDQDRKRLIMFLVLIVSSATGIALLWAWGVNSWLVYLFVAGIWFGSTLGIRLKVKQARNPKLWGVPYVPWLPSCSIALNLFMMGSIDGASFLRFMGWTALLLTYYFLVGLHASYDASKETIKTEVNENEAERVDAGERVSTTPEDVELNTITTSRT